MYSQPGPSGGAAHRDAASGAPPGPVFTSPVRARDAAAGIVLLDDDDATAGNGGAGSARKARSRTRDAGGDAAAAAGTASSWETHSVQGPAGGAVERQQPRLLQFGGPEPHEAGRDSMVATSSSQYDAASGGGYLGDEPSQGRIDDGDDPSGAEGGAMRAVPQPGGEAYLYAGDSAADSTAGAAAYTWPEGVGESGAEADESVSDLLILLGQESRRVEALREALEEVGVDSRAVLAQLQKQEDDEMLASMTGGAGGDAGEQPPPQGGGGDSTQGVATSLQPAAAMVGQHQVWQPAPAATPFGAQQDEDDELALVASLPAPGRGLPAPPPVVVRQQIAVAAHIV